MLFLYFRVCLFFLLRITNGFCKIVAKSVSVLPECDLQILHVSNVPVQYYGTLGVPISIKQFNCKDFFVSLPFMPLALTGKGPDIT